MTNKELSKENTESFAQIFNQHQHGEDKHMNQEIEVLDYLLNCLFCVLGEKNREFQAGTHEKGNLWTVSDRGVNQSEERTDFKGFP